MSNATAYYLEDCALCRREFEADADTPIIETSPATGPTYACAGDPAEFGAVCPECAEGGWDGEDERI